MEQNILSIPKKIHFIWYGAKMPQNIASNVEKVKKMYPDYKVKIWNEKDFNPSVVKYTRIAQEKKKWAFVSDYLRVKILYEQGGIYIDTDMLAMENIDELLTKPEIDKTILGFEYNQMVTTGFVASVPGHPLFKEILDVYEGFNNVEDKDVKFIVNNEIWTYFLVRLYGLKTNGKEQLLPTGIKVYPREYFALHNEKEHKKSYFLHKHELSWTSPMKAFMMNFFLINVVRRFQKPMQYILEGQKQTYFFKNWRIIRSTEKAEKRANKNATKYKIITDERTLETKKVKVTKNAKPKKTKSKQN